MKKTTKWGALAVLGVAAVGLAGCGTTQSATSQWMTVDSATHTVDFKVVSSHSSSKQVNTFDGYTNGHLVLTVPKGYHVKMDFVNNGPIPAAVGIYQGHHLAFANAGMSYRQVELNPTAGLLPGQSQTFDFTANHVGTYKLSDVLYGNNSQVPSSGQWDIVKVVPSGTPSLHR